MIREEEVIDMQQAAFLPFLSTAANHSYVQNYINSSSINTLLLCYSWILYVLSTNIDPIIYRDIMMKLSKEIDTANSNNPYNSAGLYSSSSSV